MGSLLWELMRPGSCPRCPLMSCNVVGCLQKGSSDSLSRTSALCLVTVQPAPLTLGWPCDLLWPKGCGGGDSGPVLSLSLRRLCALPLSLSVSKPCRCYMNKPGFVCWRIRGKWSSHLITPARSRLTSKAEAPSSPAANHMQKGGGQEAPSPAQPMFWTHRIVS